MRFLISALTAGINSLAPAPPVRLQSTEFLALTPAALREHLRADFEERCYLFTGSISTELYDDACLFTDPTLSFRGVATFERNLSALQPLLKALLATREVTLQDCTLVEESGELQHGEAGIVVARWRMAANISLPWRPRLDICGVTRFFFAEAEDGGRIVRYLESWDRPAVEALAQLVTPSRWAE